MKLYEFNGKEFVMTLKAKIAIENYQKSKNTKMFDGLDAEAVKMMMEIEKQSKKIAELPVNTEEEKEIKTKNTQELETYYQENLTLLMPVISKMNTSEDEENLFALKALLKNYRKTKKLTDEEIEDLLEAMEEELGLDDYMKVIGEIRGKVFTWIQNVNNVMEVSSKTEEHPY